MVNLGDALSRLGVNELAGMLGQDAVTLLEKLDVRNITATRLAKLILRELDPSSILLDKRRRLLLLNALKKSDAEKLAQKIQVGTDGDPWSVLSKQSFSRKSKNAQLLFNFFGCELPVLEAEAIATTVSTVDTAYPLFQHQRTAIHRVLTGISETPKRALLHMPTGSGKTRTAMNVIAEILRQSENLENLVVWLAHSEELCDQAVEEFYKSWRSLGDRSVNVYRYYSKYDFDLSKATNGLIVAGLGKLYNRSFSQMPAFLQMCRRVGLVIMDEAHQAVAPTYQHLLNLLAPTENVPILGLSATPGRSFLNPGEDIKLATYFYNKKVTLEVEGYESPVDYLQNEGYLAKPEFIKLSYNPSFELSLEDTRRIIEELEIPSEVIAKLARDERRNLSILLRIIEESVEGNKIIVFACSVDHAKLLSNLLNVKGFRCAAITSDTPSHQRTTAIKSFRDTSNLNILTNFGVLTTGFDAPKANVAFIVRPTKSMVLYSQMIGRVIRGPKVGGNKTCKIITVADHLAGFKSIADGFSFWEDIW